MRRVGIVLVAAVLIAATAVLVGTGLLVDDEDRPAPFDAWPDSTFGAVVVEGTTTRFAYRPHAQFRSASLVKLLIAVDVLERPEVAEADRVLVAAMLRASDDDAASVLWARYGAADIVRRTAARLGLPDTEPPASRPSWGYTATSAADVARVYSHLLDGAAPAVRDAVLGALRASTPCAVDGRDQLFGVGRVLVSPPNPPAPNQPAPDRPASKQGWSGFGTPAPGAGCVPAPRSAVDPTADDRARVAAGPAPADTGSDPDIDLDVPAAHTSGVVGAGTIVVVLGQYPEDTPFDDAAAVLDDAVRGLPIGGGP